MEGKLQVNRALFSVANNLSNEDKRRGDFFTITSQGIQSKVLIIIKYMLIGNSQHAE